MIVTNDQELEGLKKIGRIVALAREEMKRKAEPGMSTKTLTLSEKLCLMSTAPFQLLRRNMIFQV